MVVALLGGGGRMGCAGAQVSGDHRGVGWSLGVLRVATFKKLQ